MITQQDIYRQLYPEIQNRAIYDSHLSDLILDCIEGVIPKFRWAYIAVFGLVVWMII